MTEIHRDTNADRVVGLLPVTGETPEVLVLGSFPSRLSLEKNEYYGNPQNQFWKIAEILFGIDHRLSYDDRIAGLTSARIALWDTVFSCMRTGSADSTIREPVPNDIPTFLESHPSIRLVALNGKAAGEFLNRAGNTIPSRIQVIILPSTSPANARMSLIEKARQWSVIRTGPVKKG